VPHFSGYNVKQLCAAIQSLLATNSQRLKRDFNILKHSSFGLILILINLMMRQLCFQGVEEAFRHRIIPAVTFATRALPGAVLF